MSPQGPETFVRRWHRRLFHKREVELFHHLPWRAWGAMLAIYLIYLAMAMAGGWR